MPNAGNPSLMTDRRRCGRREPRLVLLEVVANLGVGLDYFADTPRGGLVALVDRRRGYQALDVEVVRICQEPHQRLRIVRLVLDVGEHEYARLAWSDMRDLRARWFDEADQNGGDQNSGELSSHVCRLPGRQGNPFADQRVNVVKLAPFASVGLAFGRSNSRKMQQSAFVGVVAGRR